MPRAGAVRKNVRLRVHTHIRMYDYVMHGCSCVYTYEYACKRVCVHVCCVCACMHACVCVCVCVCVEGIASGPVGSVPFVVLINACAFS